MKIKKLKKTEISIDERLQAKAMNELAILKGKYKRKEGVKFDGGKLPWHLLAWDAIEQIVKVLAFGASKYSERNWEQGINYDRLFAAIIRHLTAWWGGETYDKETKLNHMAHVMCDAMFLLAYSIRGKNKFDNRPKV